VRMNAIIVVLNFSGNNFTALLDNDKKYLNCFHLRKNLSNFDYQRDS